MISALSCPSGAHRNAEGRGGTNKKGRGSEPMHVLGPALLMRKKHPKKQSKYVHQVLKQGQMFRDVTCLLLSNHLPQSISCLGYFKLVQNVSLFLHRQQENIIQQCCIILSLIRKDC